MQYVKILGSASSIATTQIHELDLPVGGSLFLLLTIHSTEPALSRIEAMRGAVNFLHHELSKHEFDFDAFKSLFQKTITPPQFQAVCTYVKDNLVYVFVVGGANAFLQRNGQLTPLLGSSQTLHSASGYLKKEDSLVLVTDAFLKLVPLSELVSYVSKKKLLALEEDSATRIQDSESRGDCGLVFLSESFDEEGDDKVSQVSEEPEVLAEETPVAPANPSIEDEPAEEKPLSLETSESSNKLPILNEEPQESINPSINNKNFFARSDMAYEARGKSKKMAYIGLALIALLGVSVYAGQKARKSKEEQAKVQTTIAKAQEALSEAKKISTVNKAQARDLIVNAREQVLGIHTENKYPELSSIEGALTEGLGTIAGVYEIKPEIFSDLTLISQSTKANKLSISDGIVRVLSKDDKKIITIELPGKRTETLSGGSSLSNPTGVSAYAKKTFVIASDGVYDVGSSSKKQFDLPAGEGSLLFSSFAGNIYMLDKSQNQIWRYAGDGSSFGEKKEWLSEGVEVDFSKVTSMAIDGSIWVYSETGKLVKFTIGNPQTFSLKGLPKAPSSKAVFFTDGDSENLYLLDPEEKSIFVFNKNGELIATYSDSSLAAAENLIVSESNNLMLVGSGSKLLSFPTKHINK